MDLQINLEKNLSHGSPLGEDEIKLVRKKLKWIYKPFEIPKKFLNEWRIIGEKLRKKAEKKLKKTIKKKDLNN